MVALRSSRAVRLARRRMVPRPRLRVEPLEARRYLAVGWQNLVIAEDVDDSGFVALADLLAVVADLRQFDGARELPPVQPGAGPPPYLDCNGDGSASVPDLILVIESLRAGLDAPPVAFQAGLLDDDGEQPDDRVTSDPTIAVQITAGLLPETRLVARVDQGPWFRVGTGPQFTFDPGLARDGSADGFHSVQLVAQTQGGPVAMAELTFTLETPDAEPIVLTEGAGLVVEQSVPVALGQAQGSRTLRFSVEARFDNSDTAAVSDDLLLVYLVDPADRSRTLLDRGQPGTALIALSSDGAEYPPGLVRFNGTTVEIDVTGLGFLTRGELVFQLVNGDDDTGGEATISPVASTVDPDGAASPRFDRTATTAVVGGALDIPSLAATSEVEVQLHNVRLSPLGRYTAELSVRNRGPALGRTLAVSFPGLPAGVMLANRSGLTPQGNPYLNLANAVPRGGLGAGAVSAAVLVEFDDPNFVRFALRPQVLTGGPNRPPALGPLGPLKVKPGERLEVQLAASDPDGDAVRFLLESDGELPAGELRGDGTLTFTPTPGQVGEYNFTVIADDGAARATQEVTLEVMADPIATSRVSGRVVDEQQEPLADVPITLGELQTTTAADGSFTLDAGAGGPLPSDLLTIDGQALAAAADYPTIAMNVSAVLGRAAFENVNNVLPREIVLSPLNIAGGRTLDPAQTQIVPQSLASGGIATLLIAANTATDAQGQPFAGTLSITEVPLDAPPIPLPDSLFPNLAVIVAPAGLRFTAPASLVLPNRAGWAPGVLFDLWALDPATGQFVDVGDGRVNAMGDAVETVSGGVNAGGLHFFSLQPATPLDVDEIVFNEDTGGFEVPATAPLTSEVELHSGAVLESHDLACYRSQEVCRDAMLRYDSLRADPRPIVHFGYPDVDPTALAGDNADNLRLVARLTVRRGDFSFTVPGAAPQFGLLGDEHFWTIPAEGGRIEAALQADLSAFPSGKYEYEVVVGVLLLDGDQTRFVGATRTETGVLLHVNGDERPFGHGWDLAGWQRLVENPDRSVLLVDGDGSELLFPAITVTRQLSTFDGFNDGWTTTGDARSPTHVLTGGNPGGHVTANDRDFGETWYWQAPFGFLGNVSSSYGEVLAFDLKQSATGALLDDDDVVLVGDTATLVFDTPTDPGSDWTSYAVQLDETAGWTNQATGQPVTQAEMQAVLGSLSALLIRGEYRDGPDTGGLDNVRLDATAYASPEGDFSTLEKTDEGDGPFFRRTMRDQTIHEFNAQGELASMRDRNGNEWRYVYDGENRLIEIVDPVGLKRTFTYLDERVSEIRDPADRVTRLEYDAAGNLMKITDPDDAARTFGYDVRHLLKSELTPREFTEETTYGFHGRVLSGMRADGSVVQVAPIQVQGLFPPEDTSVPFTAPAQALDPHAMQADPNGNVEENEVDQQGELRRQQDALGSRIEILARNERRLPTRVRVDDRIVNATYDDRGNLTGFNDNLSATGPAAYPLTDPGVMSLKVLFGDFNGDGRQDLASLNNFFRLTVLLGQADGSLRLETTLIHNFANDFAVGDLNGDGFDDLIVGYNRNQSQVAILLSDGDGKFNDGAIQVNARTLQMGSGADDASAASVALADIDGDGDLDAMARVIEPDGSQALVVRRNQGDGRTFGAAEPFGLPNRTDEDIRQMLAGDVDGDADQDVVLLVSSNEALRVVVLRNNGAGAFTRVDPTGATEVVSLAAADFNRDGRLDLVGKGGGAGTGSDQLKMFLGNADGTFTPQPDPLPDILVGDFAVGDVNGDSNPDLVVEHFDTTALLLVLRVFAGNGDGTFTEGESFDPGNNHTKHRTLGDIDGDGDLDTVGVFDFDTFVAVAYVNLNNSGAFGPPVRALPTVFAHDPVFNQLTEETDDLGRRTLYDIDPANGNVLEVRRVRGMPDGEDDDVVTTYTYTPSGQVETETDPLGRVTRYTYTPQDATAPPGMIESITYAVGTPDEGTRRFEYDAAGNQTAVIDENDHRTEYEYDAMNRRTLVRDALGRETRFTYDAAGNLETTTDALDRVTTNEYDELNRLERTTEADPDGAAGPLPAPITQYTYDEAGYPESVTDPLDRATRTVYDERGRLIESIDALGKSTRYEYDGAGNRTTLIDPKGNRTEWEYDARNRMTRETDPLGQSMTWEYDSVDNLQAKTDRNGRRIEYDYDELDRRTTETWVVSGGAPANVITTTYDDAGNRLEIADQFSNLTYAYDNRNRVQSVSNAGTPGAPEVELTYTYDAFGNVKSLADTLGGLNEYDYDELNRVRRLTQSGAGVSPKRVDFTYNEVGRYDAIQRFADLAGTQLVVRTTHAYDRLDRLTSLVHANATENVAFYNFTFDEVGRLVEIEDIDGLRTYDYDDTDQLTGAVYTDEDRADEDFAYDDNGNRVGTGIVTGDGNRLLSDGTFNYEYDDEGNLILRTHITSGAEREFQWDYRNRLTAVIDRNAAGAETQRVEYTYDATDRRIAKHVENAADEVITHFVYDREDVLLDFVDADGPGAAAAQLAVRYLHGSGIDQVMAQEDAEGQVLWLLPDHLGSTRDLVDNAGVVKNHVVYDAFGKVVSQSDTAFSARYLFTGREFDVEIGLNYYRARHYDSAIGRFLSEDPWRFDAGDSNLYRYVKNQPVLFTDPTGRDLRLDDDEPVIAVSSEMRRVVSADPHFWFGDSQSEKIVATILNLLSKVEICIYNIKPGATFVYPNVGDNATSEVVLHFLSKSDELESVKCRKTGIFASIEWSVLVSLGVLAAGRVLQPGHKRRRRTAAGPGDAAPAHPTDAAFADWP